MKKSILVLLILLFSINNVFSQVQDSEIFRYVIKFRFIKVNLDSYSLYPDEWNKSKLDTLFSKILYLENFFPKYIGTRVIHEDTFEQTNVFKIPGEYPIYLYTNNRKQSIFISRFNFISEDYRFFTDMLVPFSLTKSILNDLSPDYNLKRLEKWVENQ